MILQGLYISPFCGEENQGLKESKPPFAPDAGPAPDSLTTSAEEEGRKERAGKGSKDIGIMLRM